MEHIRSNKIHNLYVCQDCIIDINISITVKEFLLYAMMSSIRKGEKGSTLNYGL